MTSVDAVDRPAGGRRLRRIASALGLVFLLGVSVGAGVASDPPVPPVNDQAVPVRTAPAGPTAPPGTIVIPASCRAGLDRARQAADVIEEAAQAVRQLESARLQRALNRLQQAERELDDLAARCRAQATALH